MKGTLKLTNPIFLDGEEVSEIAYDFSEITLKDRIYIYKSAHEDDPGSVGLPEFDSAEHVWAFAFAASKARKASMPKEFLTIRGKDALRATELGRAFFTCCAVEDALDGEASTGAAEPSN